MRVCPDTNIWIEIFNHKSKKTNPINEQMIALGNDVVNHPLVRLELLLGAGLSDRQRKLVDQDLVTDIAIPSSNEVENCVKEHLLGGSGLDIVDLQIIMGCIATGYVLWTQDEDIVRNAPKLGLMLFSTKNEK